jgi:hypothetical protein
MVFEIYFSVEDMVEIDFSKIGLKINCQYCHKYIGTFIPEPRMIVIVNNRGN